MAAIPGDPLAERLARDARRALEAQAGMHLAHRWMLVPLSLSLAVAAGAAASIRAPLLPLAGLPVLTAALTAAAQRLLRTGRFAEWQLRALVGSDALTLAAVAALLGPHGYLVAPLVVVGATQSTFLSPRVGRAFTLLALAAYPAARVAGAPPQWAPLAIEWTLLAGLCTVMHLWQAALVRRLQRARVALGRVEDGDLTVRVHDRHLDNVGLLAASLDRTVGALRALAGEVQAHAHAVAALAGQGAAAAREVEAAAGEIGAQAGSIA
ncbi:MAG TPA: hypothetical protein VFX98_11740, partial [Longimicrobiaceae bacterium]|nr:hypothetical protein [Longimicrobiaceae bacterium]